MLKRPPSTFSRYVVTISGILIATILRLLLNPILKQEVPFIFYFPAIVICSWFGGLWAGLATTLGGTLLSSYFFMAPKYSLSVENSAEMIKLVIFLIGGVLISFFAENLHQTRRQIEESEARERNERNRFHVTLSSIGDAVIATDVEGKIQFMNQVAESLTGWKLEDAIGKRLEEIFKIVDEQTRTPVENPAFRAIQAGLIYGMANHTILIARDGSEIPVEDSGAPIRDSDGKIIGAVLTFRDVSARRMADEQRSLLANIVESSDDAIITKNLEGIITSWNKSAEKMYGFTASEAIGKAITIIIPEDLLDEEKVILGKLRKGERIEHYETIRMSRDGRRLNVSLTVSPVRDSNGQIIGASKVARDITFRRKAEAELTELLKREKAARNTAEVANQTKDEFLAKISHELRTPLSAIFGWIGLLNTKTLDVAGSSRALETIEQSAKALSRLVEDLLDVSRITSGKFEIQTESLDLVSLIESSLQTIRPAANAKSIQLESALDPTAGSIVGDPTRLQQAISNLLSNAVKFTSKGGRVHVALRRAESMAEITVTDTGKGINREALPHLFEPFWQGSGKDAFYHGGLGLGLSIVRHLVELHGGTVAAKSDGEGLGAAFTIRLPLKAVRIVSLDQLKELPRPLPALRGIRVLVVDDEPSVREVLGAVLQNCGADVFAAGSAVEALTIIKQRLPDVLLSDIAMSDQNGYELMSNIRKLSPEEGGNIPAIALTALAQKEDRLRALAAGFQSHIAKPVEPAELALVIARLVQHPKS